MQGTDTPPPRPSRERNEESPVRDRASDQKTGLGRGAAHRQAVSGPQSRIMTGSSVRFRRHGGRQQPRGTVTMQIGPDNLCVRTQNRGGRAVATITRFDGRVIGGACSRASGVFAAYDWRESRSWPYHRSHCTEDKPASGSPLTRFPADRARSSDKGPRVVLQCAVRQLGGYCHLERLPTSAGPVAS